MDGRRDCSTGDWRENAALSAPGAEAPGLHPQGCWRLAWPAEAARGECQTEVLRRLARPPRLERGTPGLEGRCSIRLSYGRSRRAARILYDGFYLFQGISTRNALPSMSFAVTVTRLAFTLRALNGTLSRSEKRLWARTRFSPFSIRAMMVEK